MLNEILKLYGLDPGEYQILQLGTGLINHTWKITDLQNEPQFILQRINKNVFKSPQFIAENIDAISEYLKEYFPAYFLPVPLKSTDGQSIIQYSDGEYYRLLPYVKDSVTITTVQNTGEAFEAAKKFGEFAKLLDGFESAKLHYILPGFHDLSNRFIQFEAALKNAGEARLAESKDAIEQALNNKNINEQYDRIVAEKLIPLRVIHHDTKISNVLFNEHQKGICVIDLDTVMPGYYISDVGDMMRTYLSAYSEEEKDVDKVIVRLDFFEAIARGYFSEVGATLTATEKSLFVYAGKFMIYMQALRFLTDYLNNDVYYGSAYPGHNLVRAKNQLKLLSGYLANEQEFDRIVLSC